MSTPAQAKRTVVVAVGAAALVAATNDVIKQRELPHLRILVGAFVAAIMLSLIAEGAPDVASGFALMILVGALLLQGGIFARLTKILGGK